MDVVEVEEVEVEAEVEAHMDKAVDLYKCFFPCQIEEWRGFWFIILGVIFDCFMRLA